MQTLPPVGFGQAFKLGFQNYCKFTGRSRRSEFFYFILAHYIVMIFLFVIFTVPFENESGTYDDDNEDDAFFLFIPFLYLCATFFPVLSLMVRRLHDIGYSGAFVLISIIPFGAFFLLYLWCIDSEETLNAYGPSPKYIMPTTVSTNYNPPASVIAVTPVVQPALVLMPVQPTPVVQPPVAPYPQPSPLVPPPYPQQDPLVPPPVAPYPQQNPMIPPQAYPPPSDPYSKPNPMQPQTDPYYNSSDFRGQ